MGQSRSRALHVGAVKTNVSHLEGAAGIAGLLKVRFSYHFLWFSSVFLRF